MIHMSAAANLRALANIETAAPRLVVLSTTLGTGGEAANVADFPVVRANNDLNLLARPYCLRPPLRLYWEGRGPFYLALWDLADGPLRDVADRC